MKFSNCLALSLGLHAAVVGGLEYYSSNQNRISPAQPLAVIDIEFIPPSELTNETTQEESNKEKSHSTEQQEAEKKSETLSLAQKKKSPSVKKIQAPLNASEKKDDTPSTNQPNSEISSRIIQAAPNYASNPPPLYPVSARRGQKEGTVLLEVEVSTDGTPISVTIKESAHYEALDNAAVEAVRNWKFVPASMGGSPIQSKVVVPVRFKLRP